jgi:transcription factor SPN1
VRSLAQEHISTAHFFASFFLELQPQLQQKEQPRPVKPPVDDYESSGGDSEDDYEQQRPVKPTKKKRLSKKGPEDVERRPVQRKRKRKQPVEVDLSELPPEQGIFMLLLEFSGT